MIHHRRNVTSGNQTVPTATVRLRKGATGRAKKDTVLEDAGVGDGPVDAAVKVAADRLGKTASQVLLRWNLQQGRGVITTTSNPASGRIQDALGVLDFELTPDEVKAISTAGASKPQLRSFFNGKVGLDLGPPE